MGNEAGRRPLKKPKKVHLTEPDYQRPLVRIPNHIRERILGQLVFLYGEETARTTMPELERVMEVYTAHKPLAMIEEEKEYDPTNRFTEKDVILITYGDLIRGESRSPLGMLADFCDRYLEGTINTLHILPFFPYSSDRGFSVVDFETVDPKLGTWDDIEALEGRYQLMFDGVINHVSAKSRWFQEFLNGNPQYRDFFISYSSPDELTQDDRKLIFRPRTSDILTKFDTISGAAYLWTTFSQDQIDLNYQNPDVLLRVIEILLLYVRHGATIIRLDAVTFLWTQPGTVCIHLKQTHEIVKLFRNVLDGVAPRVAIITETNVPHEENISYFGNGTDEAQMVYNFALPPLVLHTFYTQDVSVLSKWAATLDSRSEATTFFNFLDSHDGIGIMAVKNILTKNDIDLIIRKATDHGGFVSYKTGANGDEEPYEINITWYSALNREGEEDVAFQVKRFVASRIISFVLQGVPGIYLHSLIGTPNDIAAVYHTTSKRDINRSVIDGNAFEEALKDPLSKISRISRELGRLTAIRVAKKAFHPHGQQKVLTVSPRVFAVYRISPEEDEHILCLINVSDKLCRLEMPLSDLNRDETHWFDLVSEMEWMADDDKLLSVSLQPYDIVWLEPAVEIAINQGL